MRPATSADYLDKIFQLSYELPQISAGQGAELLTRTVMRTQPSQLVAHQRGQLTALQSATSNETAMSAAPADMDDQKLPAATTVAARSQQAMNTATTALTLDLAELQLLTAVSALVSSSPRRAKRFVNIYRVIKARVLADQNSRDRFKQQGPAGLMLLTALATGLPNTIPQAISTAPAELTIISWLADIVSGITRGAEANRLRTFLAAPENHTQVPVSQLIEWLPVVRPYAWPPAINLTIAK